MQPPAALQGCIAAQSLVGASWIGAAASRQSAGLTDQTTGQSPVSPEAAAAAVLADTGHLATTTYRTSMTRQRPQAQEGAVQPLLERYPPVPA